MQAKSKFILLNNLKSTLDLMLQVTFHNIPNNISTSSLCLNTVRTRFVTNLNNVGLARKKAQTISFVERGFERLGLDH